MENIIESLTSPTENQKTEALKLILSHQSPLSEDLAITMVKYLKPLLQNTESPSLLLSLQVLCNFLQKQTTLSALKELFPELIKLILCKNPQIHEILIVFFEEFISRTNDLKFIGSCFINHSFKSQNEDIQLNSLIFMEKILKNEDILTALGDYAIILSNDSSENVKNLINRISSGQRGVVPIQKKRKTNSDLYFNLIPSRLIERINRSQNAKDKYQGIQVLEEFITSQDSLSSLNLTSFISYFSKLLEDANFKISLSCLLIVSSILASDISNSQEIFTLIPLCIKKLGDNTIPVRQAAHKLFRQFLKINIEKTLNELLSSLEISNWHIKEEVIVVFIASMLLYPGCYKYMTFLTILAKLLDDPRAKIRLVSTEALAVIADIYGAAEVIGALVDIVDSQAIKIISERFSVKSLPLVTEEYIMLSKDVPKECRLVSSPYFIASPLETPNFKVFSYGKTTPGTATSADTSVEKAHKKTANHAKSLRLLENPEVPTLSITQTSDMNPAYIPYEELTPVPHPSEALQKLVFHTEDWLEQFEVINTVRKLVKFNPEVFLSRVTLHNIVLCIVKWADSLRSSLSKNCLIALKEMCISLGKVADGEIIDMLRIFLRKAADTSSFLGETGTEGLEALCVNCSENKVLGQLIIVSRQLRNPGAKAKLMFGMGKIIDKAKSQVLKFRDIAPALECMNMYMIDANPEVRDAAKSAYDRLVVHIPDEKSLELVMNFGMRENVFRKLKDSVKRKEKNMSASMINLRTKEMRVTLPSLSKPKNVKLASSSAREILPPIMISEPEELKLIAQMEADIQNPEWKIRHEVIKSAADFLKSHLTYLETSNKLKTIMQILQKGLKDTNLKVLLRTLNYLAKIIPILKSKIEQFLGIIVEPLVISMGCSNTSIKSTATDVGILLTIHTNNEIYIVLLVENISKTTSKGKAIVLNLCVNMISGIKDKCILIGQVLGAAFKYMDDLRPDVRNESNRMLVTLYKVLGNTVLESVPTKKMHKVISVISNKLD